MAKILLVEDNKLNRDMLSRRLERKGFQVLLAANGQEAVSQSQTAGPELILMDMSMPVLDGWQATRQLKASPATRSIPVIALTAHAMVGDREKALQAGCDDYEMKPVELARLLIKIESLLNKNSPAPAEQVFSLLVVDDNEMNREMLSRRLQRPGFRVIKASSGREALDLVARESIDLLLLDSMMPEMSGLDVLRQLRQSHSIIDLPVIMVTAKDQTEDVVTALELGANDYVTKPLNFPVVLARLQTQLAIKKAHRRGAVAKAENVVKAVEATSAVDEKVAARSAAAPRNRRAAVPQREQRISAVQQARSVAQGGVAVAEPATFKAKPPSSLEDTSGPARRHREDAVDTGGRRRKPPSDQGTWTEARTAVEQPRLDGYEILGELGRGGMGVVFKARHERMNRIVALKIIDKEHLSHAESIRRFYREIQAAAQLSHVNIVLAYDAGQLNDTHYFAMEYVDGVDLGSLLKQRGPLPVEDACQIIRQAALGLQHAHERGMVHRDIKPGNLLATWPNSSDSWHGAEREKGTAFTQAPLARATIKILDMGLALLHQPNDPSEAAASLTRDNRVVGTADYMAPEQWMNAHKVDIRADLYSLGCTFYFLLTGQVPFPSEEPMEKMLKHHLDEPVPVEQLKPGIPRQIGEVVRKLMAKKPDQRYQQPVQVAEALA